jgi:hypothetical protein
MTVRALRSVFMTPALLLARVVPMCAEEGIWTFDDPPFNELAEE